MGQRGAGDAFGVEFKSKRPFFGDCPRGQISRNIVMDYNSISYFCEFVNIISWIFLEMTVISQAQGARRLSYGKNPTK